MVASQIAFKTKDAAAQLGVDESTFRRMVAPDLINKGYSPVYLGKYQRPVWTREALESYLKKCPHKPKAKQEKQS